MRQELERIVKKLREAWPEVRIIVRGDSGFCRDEIMSYCEGESQTGGCVAAMLPDEIMGAQFGDAFDGVAVEHREQLGAVRGNA